MRRNITKHFKNCTSDPDPTIHRLVKRTQEGLSEEELREDEERRKLVAKQGEVSTEVRQLQRELEEARLYNELLNTMIDIAEEQMGVDIRKKRGAKRSG